MAESPFVTSIDNRLQFHAILLRYRILKLIRYG
jgi:hypothetical protein